MAKTITPPATTEAGTYDIPGIMRLCNVSEKYVRNQVKKNGIPGVIRWGRMIRFHKPTVDTWLATQVAGATR